MNNKYNKQKGFSMVEFIVILTIFAIMTSVSLFNYNRHQSTLEQSNLAQDIALTIRQAQVYGISATNNIYGAEDDDIFVVEDYLSLNEDAVNVITDQSIRGVSIKLSGDDKKIILYADNDKNLFFNSGISAMKNDRIIDERAIISNKLDFDHIVLVDQSGRTEEKNIGILDIVFQRPYPDAIIGYRGDTNASSGTSHYSEVQIYLKDLTNENNKVKMVVRINSIGNIIIEKHEE